MHLRNFTFLLLFISVSLFGFSQPPNPSQQSNQDTTKVNQLLEESTASFSTDLVKAFNLASEARAIAEKINYPDGIARALKNQGIVSVYEGKYLEALDYFSQSLGKYLELKENSSIANLYSNIGAVYYNKGDDGRALENYLESLKYAEQAGDKYREFIALNNIGGVYNIKSATYDKALEYYLRAMKICEELGRNKELGVICVNIGNIYSEKNDDTQALFYFNKSLNAYGSDEGSLNVYNSLGKMYIKEEKYNTAIENHLKAMQIAERISDQLSIMQSAAGLGNAYQAKGDHNTALQYYLKAEAIAKELEANHELQELYKSMAHTYSSIKNHEKAYEYQTLYSGIKDTIYNTETDKKLGLLQFEFDLQKKQNEVNLLTKENDLKAVKLNRQRLVKNAFMVGLFLVFIITVLIFRGYRIKVKTHKILDRQKNEIEGLLLNILPQKVAKELQLTGQATPRHYETVSVMFTDFKGFTIIADKMNPDELVAELDACFIAFDEIIGKYGLEKIKTIGDSYMCAGGIPTANEEHPINIIKAGLDIQKYIGEINKKREEMGLAPWYIRIGVHVGPVIAGVVGKKKYAYDIWGSTVNVASRMESNGEPGKVNISASTYELVKDHFACKYRGKITAKNVGEIDMYFVENEISTAPDITISEEQVISR